MRRRERQTGLRVGFEPARGRGGRRHGGEPDQRAHGILVLRRDGGTGLVAFDEVEDQRAIALAVRGCELLLRRLQPALGGLGVGAALRCQRQKPRDAHAQVRLHRQKLRADRPAPGIGLRREARRAIGGAGFLRQHGVDRHQQLAAFGAPVGLGVDHARAQARQSIAHRGAQAMRLDMTLERARDREVGRVARIAEALVHRGLDQLQRAAFAQLELGAQDIRHDPPQRSAVGSAEALAGPGCVGRDRDARLGGGRKLEKLAAGVRRGQRRRLDEPAADRCAARRSRPAGVDVADVALHQLLERHRQGLDGLGGCAPAVVVAGSGVRRRERHHHATRTRDVLLHQGLHLRHQRRQPRIAGRGAQLLHLAGDRLAQPFDVIRHGSSLRPGGPVSETSLR